MALKGRVLCYKRRYTRGVGFAALRSSFLFQWGKINIVVSEKGGLETYQMKTFSIIDPNEKRLSQTFETASFQILFLSLLFYKFF
jgi:hypothetical protein